ALVTVEKKFTKKDSKPFAIVVLEDLTDQVEVMVWSESYTKSQALLLQGAVVQITGRLDLREERPRLQANEIKPIPKPDNREKPRVLTLDRHQAPTDDLDAIRDIIWSNPGSRRVELHFASEGQKAVRLIPSDNYKIASSPEVIDKLSPWIATS